MSEKVKLPREVAEAIGIVRMAGLTDFYIVGEAYKREGTYSPSMNVIINYITANTTDWLDEEHEKGYTHIMKALVNGYEVEETPEEKVKALYRKYANETDMHYGYRLGVYECLEALNIKIEGVNA
ncbi:hypothetical protein [Paenibacillus harenae]|uniref:hypothetical protein n=1 Tax=Paenibacillus harenae TaxID=306543 RepID=UPI0027921E87|nr:hypothetical protein [Paenibacillus harenae]MDQ0062337.1 hypothetical protein [Paenibacillus harenae]